MAGIYIHIPFCKQKCHYCSFHFSTTFEKYRSRMIDCILQEIIDASANTSSKINSIYFGGGTPSLLTKNELRLILKTVKQHYLVDEKAEITLEANPDDINEKVTQSWFKMGVNRLSVGVQSFQSEDLISMNRSHNSDQAIAAIYSIKRAGFTNYSVDLMFALPLLTDENWKKNLQQVIELNVPHLSCYNLTIEEQSALLKLIEKGKQPPLSESKSTRQFKTLMDTLSKAGYEQYEISNFCLPGQASKHNSAYWEQKEYIGIGPSAHSFLKGNRSFNVAHNVKYMNGVERKTNYRQIEKLSPENKFNEFIMTRLRCREGISINKMQNQFREFYRSISSAIQQETEKGNIVVTQTNIHLSQKGKFLADQVAMELFV